MKMLDKSVQWWCGDDIVNPKCDFYYCQKFMDPDTKEK